MTIDELARRTGMTVRNIRAHQSRGLLPPPEVRGRTGFYGSDHLARLQFIQEMQTAGFNLTAIKRMLEAFPVGAAEELLSLERLLMAPWEDADPEVVTLEDLNAQFGANPRALSKAESLGLIRHLGGERYEVTSPALLRAGEEILSIGIPLDHALAVVEKVQRHCQGIAREFVRLFLKDVWEPFRDDGMPEEQLAATRRTLERLRNLASDVVLGAFNLTMSQEVESAFGKELAKAPKKKR